MAEKRNLEIFLLRYVVHAIQQISIPVGIIVREPNVKGGFADVRFTQDWRRVRYLDPDADLEMISALEQEIRLQLASIEDQAVLLQRFEDSFSSVVQFAPAGGCRAEDPADEMNAIASMYLEATQVGGKRELMGRQKIMASMREAFKQAGVEKFLLPIPVAPYTKPGDPFRFDFGYRVRNEIKLFQAVSLKGSVDSAVMLAGRYPKIAPVMSAKTDSALALTAVIDDDLDRGRETIQFALNIMEDEKIRIAVAAEMPLIAEIIRHELKA
jgi:hypothetical protein